MRKLISPQTTNTHEFIAAAHKKTEFLRHVDTPRLKAFLILISQL